MELITPITIPSPPFKISHADNIIMLGSCFTENIGQKLVENKFNVDINPFGPLYNLTSVIYGLAALVEGTKYRANELFEHNGMYHSFYHHSRFSAPTADECLKKINDRLAYSCDFLKKATILIITAGSSYVYHQNKKLVTNCHKLPASRFTRAFIEVEKNCATLDVFMGAIKEYCPNLHVVLTVSPIRHLADGAHNNQLSKASLLLGMHKSIEKNLTRMSYFPAYEIMMDELRDYRFYADDMAHPSPLAIDYIWERFKNCYMDEDTQKGLIEWQSIHKSLNHKPFDFRSKQYQTFLSQTLLKMEQFQQKFPFFDTSKEIELLKSKQS